MTVNTVQSCFDSAIVIDYLCSMAAEHRQGLQPAVSLDTTAMRHSATVVQLRALLPAVNYVLLMAEVHGSLLMAEVHGSLLMAEVHGSLLMAEVHGSLLMAEVHGSLLMAEVHGSLLMAEVHGSLLMAEVHDGLGIKTTWNPEQYSTLVFTGCLMLGTVLRVAHDTGLLGC